MNGTPILTDPGAKVNGNGPKIDWKFSVFLVVLNLIAIGVQWGARDAKLEELYRRQDQEERHLEFIDNELRISGADAAEVREFRREIERRLDSLDKKLDARR